MSGDVYSTGRTLPELLQWAQEQSWSHDMQACLQDPNLHKEGDVLSHTVAVCQELSNLSEWKDTTEEEKYILTLAAILHDVGKPRVTIREGDRITSAKHSIVGAGMARKILSNIGIDYKIRDRIVRLVRYHTAPPHIVRSDSPQQRTIALSWRVEVRLLYMLALADAMGRKSKDKQEYVEWIKLWKILCDENDCFDHPFPFANDHARFLFFRDELSSIHYAPHEDYSCEVTLMVGLPGAGKDGWCTENCPELPVISLDAVRRELGISPSDNQGRVVQEAKARARFLLRAGTSFVFNATNTVRATRRRWIDLFHQYKAKIKIVYVELPMDHILKQNRKRSCPVPEEVTVKLFNRLDVPDLTECHEIIFA